MVLRFYHRNIVNSGMSDDKALWKTVLLLRDEIALYAHLLRMDLRDEWQRLDKRFEVLEQKLEHTILEKAHQFGKAEEAFFVGDRDEIQSLINDLNALKKNKDDET